MINRQQMSARYETTRNDFVKAMKAAGGRLQHILHPSKGPSGEALFMDVGVLGNDDADNLMLITSGTHGVEGYLGSELQTQLLNSGVPERYFANTAFVFVSGVNPYGMAWHRRVNENNVDLNRNFLDFNQKLPTNEGYDLLSKAVNPTSLNSETKLAARKEMTLFLEREGLLEYIRALSGGQYHCPQGVQFGGQEAQWSVVELKKLWSQTIPNRKSVVNIDLHSGLGNWGEGVVMINGQESDKRIQDIQANWGAVMVSPPPTEGDTIMSGVMGHFLESQYASLEVVAAVFDFGTLDIEAVAIAGGGDNWLCHHGDIDSAQGQAIKRQLFEAFYVEDERYRRQAYDRTVQVLQSAIALQLAAIVPEEC